jgi:hypothetical protein
MLSKFHMTKLNSRWLLAAALFFTALYGCLNPAFVNGLSGGSVVPLAPGDAPYIQVILANATTKYSIGVQLGWTPAYQGVTSAALAGIAPGAQHGMLLGCPIDRIGLGNPLDLTLPALTLDDGTTVVNVPASAFPLTVSAGTDFSCGDSILFTVTEDRTNGYGIQVAAGRIEGSTQTGPFSGPDTFQIYNALQLSTGIPPTPVP